MTEVGKTEFRATQLETDTAPVDALSNTVAQLQVEAKEAGASEAQWSDLFVRLADFIGVSNQQKATPAVSTDPSAVPAGHAAALVFARSVVGQTGVQRLDTPRWRGQCVSLVARYIQETILSSAERSKTREFGDGVNVASNLAQRLPEYFSAFKDVTKQRALPHVGAVVSFGRSFAAPLRGHTAVVIAARNTAHGREVLLVQSNQDNQGEASVANISPWTNIDDVTNYGQLSGWVNPKT